MAGLDTNRGAKRAREVREEFGLGPIAPIDCLLTVVEQEAGIPVSFSRLPEGVEGVCTQVDDKPMLWVNAHDYVPRSRFTLAHEFGHLRCGHDASLIIERFTTMLGRETSNTEVQANAFAAELLVPKEAVVQFLDGRKPTLERAVELAVLYRVSAHVAAFRFTSLGLIDSDAELKAALAADEHLPLLASYATLAEHRDGVADVTTGALPRISPKLVNSSLGSLLRGEASVEDVAVQTGTDREVLATSLELFGL